MSDQIITYQNAPQSRLSDNIGTSETVISIADTSTFPSSGTAILKRENASEAFTYSGKTTRTLTGLVRPTPIAHQIGELVEIATTFPEASGLGTAASVDVSDLATTENLADTNATIATVEDSVTKRVQVEIDFGLDENSIARQFVPATWVTADSIIDCNPVALETDDHDMDDIVVEGLIGYATRLQPGVGFNLLVLAPNQSWGRYKCNCQGR